MAGGGAGDGLPVVAGDDVQCQVDAGRDPRRGKHLAVLYYV